MKYQWKVITLLCRQKFYKQFIWLLFFFACMLLVTYMNPVTVNNDIFQSLVGVFDISKFSFLDYLWNFYQLFVMMYIIYQFLSYEEETSIEYMILRKNYMTLLFQKLIYIFLFIIVYKTIIYLVSWLFFNSFITLSYWTCIDTMIPYFIFTLLIALFYFFHIKK